MTLKAQIVYNKETENNLKFHMNTFAVLEKRSYATPKRYCCESIHGSEIATLLNMRLVQFYETENRKTICLLPSVSPMWMVQ